MEELADAQSRADSSTAKGSPWEVLRVFLRLGTTSFGGPIAHLGYFHRELVERRRWVSESEYAQLLALCQFLPGPASSQLGFALGLLRAGWAGAVAAFVAFTLPSALLLLLFAASLPRLSGPLATRAVHGLELVALVVVFHGVVTLARKLCPDAARAWIAALAAALVLVVGGVWSQQVAVLLGALGGLLLVRDERAAAPGEGLVVPHGVGSGALLLAVFCLLLVGLPQLAQGGGAPAVAEAFYRSGSLVFGGGHVVLPLLEETVVDPGWIPAEEFLAGYGAAQAVPGPMFSFAAFLGALLDEGPGGAAGALLALLFIFLPGFLLVGAVLPWWKSLLERPAASRAVAGVGAAVVGLLGAALYDPVWTTAVRGPEDLAIAVCGWTLLAGSRLSALWVVAWCVGASSVRGVLGF